MFTQRRLTLSGKDIRRLCKKRRWPTYFSRKNNQIELFPQVSNQYQKTSHRVYTNLNQVFQLNT